MPLPPWAGPIANIMGPPGPQGVPGAASTVPGPPGPQGSVGGTGVIGQTAIWDSPTTIKGVNPPVIMEGFGGINILNFSGTNPRMGGFGSQMSFAPSGNYGPTSRMVINIWGLLAVGGSGGGTNVQLRYGTGAPPAAGAAATGTSIGQTSVLNAPNGLWVPFSINTGGFFSTGVQFWLDICVWCQAALPQIGTIESAVFLYEV